MLTEMRIDLAKLDAESTNLDLIVRPSCALHDAIWKIASKISGPVLHAIANALPETRLCTREIPFWVPVQDDILVRR
ncbi:hypothetical protein BDZ97DRAFT_1792153 [Flammula alnicola]|nr:hypothetical protein BDZ97DRAFT_1792153 [Flammula alnicola]